MRTFFKTLLVCLVFLGKFSLWAQEVNIHHSDRLESTHGGDIIELFGNVDISHGTRMLSSQYAKWEKLQNTVSFRGDVAIADTNYTIHAADILYRRIDQTAQATGSVHFIGDAGKIDARGNFGFYDGKRALVRLNGNAELFRHEENNGELSLKSKTMVHFIDEKLSIAVDSVFAVITEPSDSLQRTLIWCDSLEYYHDSSVVFVYRNVKIVKDSVTIYAPFAKMYRDTRNLIFAGGVIVQDPEWTLLAETLFVTASATSLDGALATGKPKGVWKDRGENADLVPESRFEANRVFFDFESGKLNQIELFEGAKVDYSPLPTNTKNIDRHIFTGDSIAVLFAASKLESLEIHRNVRGTSFQKANEKNDSIDYKGNFLALDAEKRVHLTGDAEVRNDQMQLNAGIIDFDGETKLIYAKPEKIGDSLVGTPFMRSKNDSLRAETLVFNVDTKKGRLGYSKTAADKGYFSGEEVVKAQGDTFFVSRAKFTTCDHEPPHYHFYTPTLKLMPKDKAIVRPVVLKIDELPVFWLPFFVFSVKPGRQSGLLTLDIGKFQRGERFVRNLGYYFALNSYVDAYAAADIDEGSGIYLKSETRYALRYYFSGNIFGSYKISSNRDWNNGVTSQKRWEIRANHNQTFSEKSRFSGSLSLVSDSDYLTETHEDVTRRVERTLRSYGSYSQSFAWGGLSASADRSENLDDQTVTLYLPKLTLRKYSAELFGAGDRFYNKLIYSISGSFVNYSRAWVVDSTDTSENHYGAIANGDLSFSHSFGDYLTLSPGINYSAVSIDEDKMGEKFPVLFAWSASVKTSTDIYGNIPLGIFGAKFFHHMLTPSVSISYNPKIEGAENFYSFGEIYAPQGIEAMRAIFDLRQQFGAKVADSTGSLLRKQFFSMNTGFSYNFKATTRNFSDINTTLSSKISNYVNIGVSVVHSLYRIGENEPTGLYLKSAGVNNAFSYRFTLPFHSNKDTTEIAENKDATINITHYYAKDLASGGVTQWVKTGLSSYITPSWKFDYSFYYDVEAGKKVSDELKVWRDLHCWEISFIWVPSGIRSGYYVRLNIKDLPEIKLERTVGNVRW